MALPMMRGREKMTLLRQSPLFCMLKDEALVTLSAAAVEKEVGRYQTLRPVRSIFVLAYGSLVLQDRNTMVLTAPMPPDLLLTVPNMEVATAAGAIGLEGAVAGTASEPGATLGLSHLTGGLIAGSFSFFVTEPALLLQLPLELVMAHLPQRTLDAVGSEARLRMLLALNAFKEAQAPVPQVRALVGALTRLEMVPPGTKIFRADDPAEKLFILIHGRVDLHTASGELFETVQPSMTPPLGLSPGGAAGVDAAVQPFTAVAADNCIVLVGGAAGHAQLTALLAPRENVDVPAGASGEAAEAAESPPADAGKAGGAAGGGMGIMQALAAMRQQQQQSAADT